MKELSLLNINFSFTGKMILIRDAFSGLGLYRAGSGRY